MPIRTLNACIRLEQESHLQQAQFEWQRAQANVDKRAQEERFARQRHNDARERAIRVSIAAQLNLYEDIVKHVAPKFPSDFVDIPILFGGRPVCLVSSVG